MRATDMSHYNKRLAEVEVEDYLKESQKRQKQSKLKQAQFEEDLEYLKQRRDRDRKPIHTFEEGELNQNEIPRAKKLKPVPHVKPKKKSQKYYDVDQNEIDMDEYEDENDLGYYEPQISPLVDQVQQMPVIRDKKMEKMTRKG